MARGSHRLGVDIGGTFTDFALYEEAGGAMAIHKQLTTPDDPSRAVLEGTAALLSQNGLDLGAVSEIVHGTTLVTNAVIERKGAVTGMLTTRGFRDILDMAREKRYDVFDLRLVFPDPIVPRNRTMADSPGGISANAGVVIEFQLREVPSEIPPSSGTTLTSSGGSGSVAEAFAPTASPSFVSVSV